MGNRDLNHAADELNRLQVSDKILVVDDSDDTRDMMVTLLDDCGDQRVVCSREGTRFGRIA